VTGRDNRLDRLSSSLTAKERALLVLRSWKEGKEEEPSWRWAMPNDQAREFNRLIELMNGVNVRLRPLIVVLCLEVEKLGLRLGILATFTLWNIQALKVDDFLRYGTKRRNGHVALLADSLEHAPLRPVVYVSEEFQEWLARKCAAPTKIDEVADVHKDVLREGIAEQARYVRAVEIVISEVAAEFGGEDPALPRMRDLIDGATKRLDEAREEAERYTGPLAVGEPDAELVDKVRALVEDRRP
jgi:hypothetical protein